MSPDPTSEPVADGRIAILGAGPVGLDAALAAVDAGRPFRLYELAPHAAGNVRLWGHVKLFTPWSMNVSPRMRRHMEAAGDEVPDNDVCPTGDELCDRLLDPVAALPSIAPNLRTATRVVGVARSGLLKHQEIGTEERARHPFRLVLRGPDGKEWTEEAAAVIDATGTYSEANALGDGGVPAPGEWAASRRILRTIPDIASEPSSWAGKRILVVGAGHSAQTAIRDLARFVSEHGGTRVVWALKREEPAFAIDPDDPLPDRARLTRRAAEIARGDQGIEILSGVTVDAVHPGSESVTIELRGSNGHRHREEVDLVLSLTGYVGDHRLYRQLQVHECYATAAPMKLAAALLAGDSTDCLTQESHGAETLQSPEPNFFILGIKSYGRTNTFLMQVGWSQVDEVFSLIAPEARGSA